MARLGVSVPMGDAQRKVVYDDGYCRLQLVCTLRIELARPVARGAFWAVRGVSVSGPGAAEYRARMARFRGDYELREYLHENLSLLDTAAVTTPLLTLVRTFLAPTGMAFGGFHKDGVVYELEVVVTEEVLPYSDDESL